jgi:hypothetical protein
MTRAAPRPTLTAGALIESARGINLLCKCGHKTSLLPSQIATMTHPRTRVLDFKRRFRCSMCGRSGASSEIAMSLFDVAPFLDADAAARSAPRRPVQ